MDFGFTAEQEQLRTQVRRFLDGECPIERVRELIARDAPSLDRELWDKTTALGWQGLVVPEASGGLGWAWEDVIVVAEEMGRSLFPSPLIANAAAARLIAKLGTAEQKSRWLEPMASGREIATIAVTEQNDLPYETGVEMTVSGAGENLSISGIKTFVPDGQNASVYLVAVREAGGLSVFAVPADVKGLAIVRLQLIDETHRAAELTFSDVSVEAGWRIGAVGEARAALRDALDAQTVALAAEMVGSAEAALDLAVEYAKVRKQFGQPIGRFQGVKHKLAEIHVAVESARSLVYFASWAIDNAPDASRHVSMARNFAAEAIDRAGEECIQTHGAIGYTWECDAQLFYKRGRYSRSVGGPQSWHAERVLAAQNV